MPMLQLQRRPVQKGAEEEPVERDRCISTYTASIEVAMIPGMTTMDPPPPVIHIDQNLLLELTTRFPEVPNSVVISLIQQNDNNREFSMMALVRHSQNYPDSHTNSVLVAPYGVDPPQTGANGIRQRSDSAGSHGSVDAGQSPSSQAPYMKPVGPSLMHSSSSPAFSSGGTVCITEPGPNTAPPHPEGFSPFSHRRSVDHLEQVPERPYSPASAGYNYVPGSYGSNVINHPANHIYPWPVVPKGQAAYATTGQNWRPNVLPYGTPSQAYGHHAGDVPRVDQTTARPGQFEQNFPAAQYGKEVTFSPDSPSRTGASPQSVTSGGPSPATTPVRQRWDGYSAVAPPSMTKTPPPATAPGYGLTTPPPHTESGSSITFVSQVSKYIGPQGPNNNHPAPSYHAPPSINIRVGQPTPHPPFNMSSLTMGLGEPHHMTHTGDLHNMTRVRFSMSAPCSSDVTSFANQSSLLTDHDHQMNRVSQQPIKPIMSPGTSTPSEFGDLHRPPSTESGSSHPDSREDIDYLQSLLLHQRSRLEKLRQDFNCAFNLCDNLRKEVSIKEKCLLDRRKSRSGVRHSISMTDLQKVREENRMLQVDSHLLTLEFDRITKGEPVIGRDVNEDFYARIPGGQQSILPSTSSPPEGTCSPNNPLIGLSHMSTHPPAPPVMVCPGHDPGRELHHVCEAEEENWSCTACTFANHPELSSCEICNMPRLGRR